MSSTGLAARLEDSSTASPATLSRLATKAGSRSSPKSWVWQAVGVMLPHQSTASVGTTNTVRPMPALDSASATVLATMDEGRHKAASREDVPGFSHGLSLKRDPPTDRSGIHHGRVPGYSPANMNPERDRR